MYICSQQKSFAVSGVLSRFDFALHQSGLMSMSGNGRCTSVEASSRFITDVV
jgi:hypothetical protein